MEDLDPLESLARSSLHFLEVNLLGENGKRLEARVEQLQQLIFQNRGSDRGWSLAEWNEFIVPRRALKEVYYEFEDESTSSLLEGSISPTGPRIDDYRTEQSAVEVLLEGAPFDLEHEAGIESENSDD